MIKDIFIIVLSNNYKDINLYEHKVDKQVSRYHLIKDAVFQSTFYFNIIIIQNFHYKNGDR